MNKQGKCSIKFKRGEVVLVLRKAKTHEEEWNNSWESEMNKSVGKKLLVIRDNGHYGVQLDDGKYNLDYPRHVLKKVKQEEVKRNEPNV